MPFILVQSLWFFKRIYKAFEHYQEQEARLSSTLQENISAIRIVRAFARQDFEKEKFEKENWTKFKRGRKMLTLHSLYWPTSDILCVLQMLLIFFLGARMAISGEISMGTYMAVSGMIIWIIWPMRNLGRIVQAGTHEMLLEEKGFYRQDRAQDPGPAAGPLVLDAGLYPAHRFGLSPGFLFHLCE